MANAGRNDRASQEGVGGSVPPLRFASAVELPSKPKKI